jgi:hypothetical protein
MAGRMKIEAVAKAAAFCVFAKAGKTVPFRAFRKMSLAIFGVAPHSQFITST